MRTIINLLQSNLCIVWQCLLSFCAQHESLWFLRCSHCACLRIHDGHAPRTGASCSIRPASGMWRGQLLRRRIQQK